MKKKFKRNLILIVLGTLFLLLGITLIVLYQNRSNFSKTTINSLKVIHGKIILDYILVIIGTVLLSIPFFDKLFSSAYNLSEVKIKKPILKSTYQENKIKELETKVKQLEKEKNKNLSDSKTEKDD